MEIFLDRFIAENNSIKRLQRKLIELESLLEGKIYLEGRLLWVLKKNYTDLKKKITATERDFNKLKKEFNNYLVKIYIREDGSINGYKKKNAS